MNNPFFSIIIPAYNRAYILPQTIKSVISQSFINWELILIDDGSTDNTKEVVSSFDDSRIKYIYQKNAERSAARNKGITTSKGLYICFLDSDDWFEKNHLEILYNKILEKKNPEALFFTNCYFYQNEKKIKPFVPEYKNPPIYLLNNPVIPARVCIHCSILSKYKFREDIVIVEDQVLWVTISFKYPVFYIPEYTVVYHLHKDNSINIKNNCFKPRLKGMQLLFSQKDVGYLIPRMIKREIISNCYYGIAKHYAFKRNYFQILINIILSIIYNPNSRQTKAKIYLLLYPQKSFLND